MKKGRRKIGEKGRWNIWEKEEEEKERRKIGEKGGRGEGREKKEERRKKGSITPDATLKKCLLNATRRGFLAFFMRG